MKKFLLLFLLLPTICFAAGGSGILVLTNSAKITYSSHEADTSYRHYQNCLKPGLENWYKGL